MHCTGCDPRPTLRGHPRLLRYLYYLLSFPTHPYPFSLFPLSSRLLRYSDLLHWLCLLHNSSSCATVAHYTKPYISYELFKLCLRSTNPSFSQPQARLFSTNDRLVLSASNTLASKQFSLSLSAITSETIMVFNRSWLGPARSRFGGEYRYEGIREKTDTKPSIFGRARVVTLLSFLITIAIFLSLVVCLGIYADLGHFLVEPAANSKVSLGLHQKRIHQSSQPRQSCNVRKIWLLPYPYTCRQKRCQSLQNNLQRHYPRIPDSYALQLG